MKVVPRTCPVRMGALACAILQGLLLSTGPGKNEKPKCETYRLLTLAA
jgi:hypothetical protein